MHIPWEILTTLIVAVFASTGFWQLIVTIYNKHANKQSDETKLLLGVAHHIIFDKCEKYLRRGWITPEELEDLIYIYTPYLSSGGNGTAKLMVERTEQLPVKQYCSMQGHEEGGLQND